MAVELEKLNIVEIIDKIGFLKNLSDLRTTYKFNIDSKAVKRFENELFAEINGNKDYSKYMQIISNNSVIFDKELYVLRVGMLAEEIYEKTINSLSINNQDTILQSPVFFPTSQKTKEIIVGTDMRISKVLNKSVIRTIINYAKVYLRNSDVMLLYIDEQNNIAMKNSQEFLKRNQKMENYEKKAKARLEEIEEKIGIERIINFLRPTDLLDICKYPNLGNYLAIEIFERAKNKNTSSIAIVHDRVYDTTMEVTISNDSTNEKGRIFDWEDFKETIISNIRYIDIDKMLLLASAVYYNKYDNDLERFSYQEALNLKEFIEKIEELLENKKASIKSQKFITEINFEMIKASIKDLHKHYINGKFYTEEQIKEIAQEIISGKRPLNSFSKVEFINTMQFTINDLITLIMKKKTALKELVEVGFLEKDQLKEIIKRLPVITSEQLKYLYSVGEIDNTDIFAYYDTDKISLENIRFLKSKLNKTKKEELEEAVSQTKLVDLYLSEDRKEEFNKYRRLYRAICIDDRDIEGKKKVAKGILDQSLELLNTQRIEDLYHKGLIPLDIYIDFNSNQSKAEIYLSGKLKPIDVKSLYNSGIIKKELIMQVLENENIEIGQKLVLIYSTFSKEEDTKIREELIEILSNTNNYIVNNYKIQQFELEKLFESNPCQMWNLLSNLDEEYSIEYLQDGYVIVYLPNVGKYVIEKLYDKNSKLAYGASNYILSEEDFEENKNSIIQKGKLNKIFLMDMKRENNAKKIIHTGWESSISKYFDMGTSNKYTKEHIRKIRRIAKQVIRSKKVLVEG